MKAVSPSCYLYPDLMIVCGETQLAEGIFDSVLNPTVIFEIVSPETEALDRGEKFEVYLKIPTLQEYLLVDQSKLRIEHFTREENKRWIYEPYSSLDSEISLSSVNAKFLLADAYKKLSF